MSYEIMPDHLKVAAPVAAGLLAAKESAPQRTLAKAVECVGVGVHSGDKVKLRLVPAAVDTGIVFFRTDLVNGARTIKARWDNVIDTRLCTVIGNDHGGKVATIEHLMAALSACSIDNVIVEINGGEVPVMDGSSSEFVRMIESVGTIAQDAVRREIEILSPVTVEHNGKKASLLPADETRFSVTIKFDRAPILTQSHDLVLSHTNFKNGISRARTFGFFEEVEQLQKMGLARGGSLDNSIVIKDEAILNEGGLRYENEFARHKVLDAVGDIALAGSPIRGHFDGYCCGHALNNQLLRALFARPDAWRIAGDYDQQTVA